MAIHEVSRLGLLTEATRAAITGGGRPNEVSAGMANVVRAAIKATAETPSQLTASKKTP